MITIVSTDRRKCIILKLTTDSQIIFSLFFRCFWTSLKNTTTKSSNYSSTFECDNQSLIQTDPSGVYDPMIDLTNNKAYSVTPSDLFLKQSSDSKYRLLLDFRLDREVARVHLAHLSADLQTIYISFRLEEVECQSEPYCCTLPRSQLECPLIELCSISISLLFLPNQTHKLFSLST